MKTQTSTNKPLFSGHIFIFIIMVLLASNTAIYSQQDTDIYSRLSKAKTALDSQIRQSLHGQVQLQRMKKEIQKQLTPETLAQTFVKEFRQTGSTKGLAKTEKYLNDYLKAKTTQDGGAISGSFTVPTTYLRKAVTVLAFDSNGYIAGIGTTNLYTLTYIIEDLQPGEYYIMTVSREYAYVDEMYDNVSAPLFSRQGWRDAQKVTVTASTTTENINFELQPSAEFLFTLYRSDGTTVSSEDEATFTLTSFDSPEKLLEGFYEYNYNDGEFEFFVPFLGDFKLGVTPYNKPTTWYKNSNNWNDADKLSIPAFTNTIDSLGIILNQEAGTTQLGKISGIISGNGEFKMIFAFKASDLSLAKNIAFIFYSFYTIEDLEPGEYYVYAEDYLGNITQADDMLGAFYEDAATLAEAQKVTVTANQTTNSINIALHQGAAIKGNVTDEENNPLADMLVVALNMDFPEASAFNLFTQMHFGVGQTDSSGNYRITGLAAGDYVLGTMSDYTFKIFWGIPSMEDGPHKGKVVNEFYPGVYNLFDFGKAQKIAVADTFTVENINFALQKAKFFRGQLSDAATSESINQALMVAFKDSSGYPFFSLPNIDYYGNYELGPFPSGKYRLLAAADHDQKDFYLPEFYENATSFDNAMPLELTSDLDNINFGFDKAAIIQGHIDLTAGAGIDPAGEDTLFNFPVVLFNAADGSFSRNAYVQFDGGFRLPRLLPGTYKLLALPIESPFAATYYGGGNKFDDPESQTIQIESGQVLDLNIELEKAGSTITGNVTGKASGEPVTNCLVIAYDQTGHAIGMSITDGSVNQIVEEPATGKYQITGLRADEYFLSTYAFTDEAEIVAKIPQYLMADDADLFEMVFGLLEALLVTDMNLYADSWYNQAPLNNKFDIPELVTSFLVYGTANQYDHARYPFFMPIPFQRSIPYAATPLMVTGNATIQNIDFQLAVESMDDIFLDIEPINKNDRLPHDYALFQNYPNPFNPSTQISYYLSKATEVELTIYNIEGQKVKTVVNAFQTAGQKNIIWDGLDDKRTAVSSGLYFFQLRAGVFQETKMMILMR